MSDEGRNFITRRRTCLLVVAAGVLVATTSGAQPAPSCDAWNTAEFFRTANPALVTACLAAGASLEELSEPSGTWPPHAYRHAMTPLHAAVNENATAAVEILLAAGADPNGRDDRGFAPLHTAVYFSPAAIALLLEAGADVHAKAEKGGATPLHYVARDSGSATEVHLLLAAGADVDVKNIPEGPPCTTRRNAAGIRRCLTPCWRPGRTSTRAPTTARRPYLTLPRIG